MGASYDGGYDDLLLNGELFAFTALRTYSVPRDTSQHWFLLQEGSKRSKSASHSRARRFLERSSPLLLFVWAMRWDGRGAMAGNGSDRSDERALLSTLFLQDAESILGKIRCSERSEMFCLADHPSHTDMASHPSPAFRQKISIHSPCDDKGNMPATQDPEPVGLAHAHATVFLAGCRRSIRKKLEERRRTEFSASSAAPPMGTFVMVRYAAAREPASRTK